MLYGFPETEKTGSGHVVADISQAYPQRGTLKFIGATVSDNAPSDATEVTVASSIVLKEIDGSPSISGVTELRIPSGTLISHGAGIAEITNVVGAKSILTRTLIADQTLGANGEWDFTSIPATFDYLEIEFSGKGITGALGENIKCYYNGDTVDANYYYRSTGTAGAGNVVAASASGPQIASITTEDSGADRASNFIARIYNYANTSYQTYCHNDTSLRRNDVGHQGYIYYTWWGNTAIVNRIQLKPQYRAAFKVGSRVRLWGIKYDTVGTAGDHTHSASDITSGVLSIDRIPNIDVPRIPDLSSLYAAAIHTHSTASIISGTFDNDRINWAAPAAIGTTTPAASTFTKVTVTPSAGISELVLNGPTENNTGINSYTYGTAPRFYITGFAAGGTSASPSALTANRAMLTVGTRAYNGSAYNAVNGAFTFTSTEDQSSTNRGVKFAVELTPSGYSQRYNMYVVNDIGTIEQDVYGINTSSVYDILLARARTLTPPAGIGYGARFRIQGHSSTGTLREMGDLAWSWDVATDGSTSATVDLGAYRHTTRRSVFKATATSTGVAWAINKTPYENPAWAKPTGTFTRTTFNTETVTLVELARRVAAWISDGIDHGER